MVVATSNALFATVFAVFVVVSLILVVLVLRFTMQRAAAARSSWLDGGDSDASTDAAGDDADHPAAEPGDLEDDDADSEDEPGMTALVLAGGGTRGAVQIGMLQVLSEHGFVPDRIYGCSVGAVNGTAFAADPSREWVEHMSEVWLALDRDSIYPQGRLHGPWMYIQQRDSVYPNTGLRRIIEDGVPYARLEDAQIPIEVVTTSLTDGGEHWFTTGPVVETVLASSAVPAIFPPVEINGERYIDGGVVDNVPIRRAIDAGATRIVVLLCTPPTFTPVLPKRPAEAILNALWISVHSRFPQDLMELPPGIDVIVCSGSEPGDRDFNDFSTTEELIAEGRREAEEIVARYGLGTPDSPARAHPDEVQVGALSGTAATDHAEYRSAATGPHAAEHLPDDLTPDLGEDLTPDLRDDPPAELPEDLPCSSRPPTPETPAATRRPRRSDVLSTRLRVPSGARLRVPSGARIRARAMLNGRHVRAIRSMSSDPRPEDGHGSREGGNGVGDQGSRATSDRATSERTDSDRATSERTDSDHRA